MAMSDLEQNVSLDVMDYWFEINKTSFLKILRTNRKLTLTIRLLRSASPALPPALSRLIATPSGGPMIWLRVGPNFDGQKPKATVLTS